MSREPFFHLQMIMVLGARLTKLSRVILYLIVLGIILYLVVFFLLHTVFSYRLDPYESVFPSVFWGEPALANEDTRVVLAESWGQLFLVTQQVLLPCLLYTSWRGTGVHFKVSLRVRAFESDFATSTNGSLKIILGLSHIWAAVAT